MSTELKEMQQLLRDRGFDPKHAHRLHAEGMGPEELRDRLRVPAYEVGGLAYSYGIEPRAHTRSSRPKNHLVWIKVPLNEAEVDSRHSTRTAAERAAAKLEKKWARGHEFGRVDVWVESPGTVEAGLRRLHDKYEAGE